MPTAASHKIKNYEVLQVALQDVLGVVVPDEQRSFLLERMEPVLENFHMESLEALADSIRDENSSESAEIRTGILDAISRKQASWQLSNEIKNLLHQYIFSQLPERARLWIVGCGQGQLAYAIAMELLEFEKQSALSKQIELIASDVLDTDIAYAKSGVYSQQQLLSLSDNNSKSYITTTEDGDGQVCQSLRDMIDFKRCDLTEDFQSMGQQDLIICPEVLVYFSNGVKAAILQGFAKSLKTGGILVTGSQQVVSTESVLERVDHPAGIFYRQKA